MGVLVVLPFRLLGFAVVQAAFALILPGGWAASAAWWPLAALVTNLLTIGLLVWLVRREGRSYRSLFNFRPGQAIRDLGWLGLALIVLLPLALLPNTALATLLFGTPQVAQDMLLHPLPIWAVILSFGFPLTMVFAELPLYFGYAMPRIERQTGRAWIAVLVPALFLSAQHVTLPLLADWRFIVWRLLMFLPFALALGLILRLRPSLLAGLVVVHGLLDLALVLLLVRIST